MSSRRARKDARRRPPLTLIERHEEGCGAPREECTCVGGPDYQVRRNDDVRRIETMRSN